MKKKSKSDSGKIHLELSKEQFFPFLVGVIITAILFAFVYYMQPQRFLKKNISPANEITLVNKNSSLCDEAKAVEKAKVGTAKIVGDYGSGSGFVISNDGYIVTNDHIVRGEANLHVVFDDGRSFPAVLHNSDQKVDIAVLKINSNVAFQSLAWGDSVLLHPGETIYAIGYPFGNELQGESSVTKGTFSAKRTSTDGLIEYIQTDTSLNPGNSGGPLINRCGEVVGINEIAIAESDGLNFAISEKTAHSYVDSMMKSPAQIAQKPANQQYDLALSPLDTVSLFYTYVALHRIEEAYNLLSTGYQKGVNIDKWISGYSNTLNVYINYINDDDTTYPSVYVKFTAVDLAGKSVEFKSYEGVWYLVKQNGEWKLDKGMIKSL